jgi:hypothetical protein
MTPRKLATELGMDPEVFRAWLRSEFPRPLAEKHGRWQLSGGMISLARRKWHKQKRA